MDVSSLLWTVSAALFANSGLHCNKQVDNAKAARV
jgi:hypothetical protein